MEDPNNQIGTSPADIADHFDGLRNWVTQRRASVQAQLDNNGPPAPRPSVE
jgi:hypothetical protein